MVKKKVFNNANVTFFHAKIEEISYFGLLKIKFDTEINQDKILYLNASNIDISLEIHNNYEKNDIINI